MSFYCYLAANCCWVLAADNKKRVVTVKTTGEGRSEVSELTTGDAHKIYPLGAGWWMTGVGLSAFLHEVRSHVHEALEAVREGAQAPVEVMERLAGDPSWVHRLYHGCVKTLRKDLPAESGGLEVLRSFQEIVFAGFDIAARPVVLRTGTGSDFTFQRESGPGLYGFAGENGTWDEALQEKIRLFLAGAAEDLQEHTPPQIGQRAWDLIPPLFQKLARAFPEKLSAHGDLVCVTPEGHQWFLF